jgi:starch synthase
MCPRDWLARLELPEPFSHIQGLEFYGKINFLKGGIVKVDRFTSVSLSYAQEIQTSEYGAGLEGVVRSRADHLVGILNGIESSEWPRDRRSKKEHKRALQPELGLSVLERIPLLAVIGWLDRQQGFDILLAVAPSLLEEGTELGVLGSGDEAYLERLRKLAKRDPRRLAVERGFQHELGRRIYASADLWLMPSCYESCGLGQMIALRYGTIPVVRTTGGLADRILGLDGDTEHGNGFSFHELSAAGFLSAVRRALRHFESKARWNRWVPRAKREDVSWNRSAGAYVEAYDAAIRRAS